MSDPKKLFRNLQRIVRFSPDEWAAVRSKLDKLNIKNFNSYAVMMLTQGRVITVDFKELVELRKEVNRIGVNINQLAKYINTSEEVTAEQYRSLQEQIQSVKDLVSDKFASESSLLEELMEKQEGGGNSGRDQTLGTD
ncbi:plasmid mobilization protein [Streptococcus ovis]|uniref:plasmid mobilization protein n=1 Tax=Streptococcus ovis TaxID=82806 RepID=UPI000378284A|nr:plasmid mobilization relaxosome protein MobC [Streptococcus ovis]